MARNDRPGADSEPADVRERRTEQPGGSGRGVPCWSGGPAVALPAAVIAGRGTEIGVVADRIRLVPSGG